ncbi:hypothetical protein [Tabrizicola sp.]|jgi:hypothetical protein|uniref:hypothetical protein n=1 Tax=Tabrizicola sp. TaxID=2005166 RepID=UPI003D2B9B43
MLESFLVGLAANAFYGVTAQSARTLLAWLRQNKPEMVDAVDAAAARSDDEALKQALLGTIEILASNGQIEISGADIEALRAARIDHEQGLILIGQTRITAPSLVTGGGAGATGQTIIGGDTVLRSQGTQVSVGAGASIIITGNASMKQN